MYALIFTFAILVLLYFKKKRKGKLFTIAEFFLPALSALLIAGMFFSLGKIISNYTYDYFFEKKYDAKVVEYDYTDGDSESDSVPIAVVEFKNERNQLLKKSTGYGTSLPIEIGKTITVTYKEGSEVVRVMNFGEMKLIASIVLFFFLVAAIGIVAIVLYVLDKDISFVGVLAFAFVIYAVFPMGMLSLLIILSKVIIDYFTGKQDDISIFALGMCFFFVIMIFFSLIGYMNMLFGKKLNLKKSNDTSRIKKILKFK